MDKSEIKRIVNEIQTQKDVLKPEELVKSLTRLKASVVATEDMLRETKVGLTVGRLRQHTSKEVNELAKDIVKKWKNDVDEDKQRKAKKMASQSKPPATPTSPTAKNGPAVQRSAKVDGVVFPSLGDKTRDACRALIYDALAVDSGAPNELLMKRSGAIEFTVYDTNGGTTSPAYRTKMRSLYLNLKGKENPSLREGVVSGDIPVARLCTMSSQDMASEERKQKDQHIQDKNLFAVLGAGEQQAETDAFQCGRCKQRKTVYRQAQTRSADEPMTTFVTCVNCNNRWKFC